MDYAKGEWKVEDGDFGYKVICDKTNPDDTIDIAEIDDYNENPKESNANAYLIAAAPEMYEALKQVKANAEYHGMSVWDYVEKALAKAEGK